MLDSEFLLRLPFAEGLESCTFGWWLEEGAMLNSGEGRGSVGVVVNRSQGGSCQESKREMD